MKNKYITHSYEQARIYRRHYTPSFNIFRLIKSVLSIIISGSTAVAGSYRKP